MLRFSFLKFYIYLFSLVFWAVLGLSCSTQDSSLRRADLLLWPTGFSLVVARGLCSLRHVDSLIEAHELSSCGTRA